MSILDRRGLACNCTRKQPANPRYLGQTSSARQRAAEGAEEGAGHWWSTIPSPGPAWSGRRAKPSGVRTAHYWSLTTGEPRPVEPRWEREVAGSGNSADIGYDAWGREHLLTEISWNTVMGILGVRGLAISSVQRVPLYNLEWVIRYCLGAYF